MIDYFKNIAKCYKPSTPIDDPELFFGRLHEKSLLYRTLISPGKHALIYGVRGIGKTSLINITTKIFKAENEYTLVTHVCSNSDDFQSIMFSILNTAQLNFNTISEKRKNENKITGELKLPFIGGIGLSANTNIETEGTYGKIIEPQLTPNFFVSIINKIDLIIVLDEFDRIKDDKTLNLIAETLKILSDNNSKTKFVIAGVANFSIDLFGKHQSLPRNLMNIQVPLMTNDELKEIIHYGAQKLSIVFEDELVELIIWLSNGLPYFTHLLSEELAFDFLLEKQKDKVINIEHFRKIIINVLKVRTYEVISYEYENVLNQTREYSPTGNEYFGDQVQSNVYPSWLKKIVLQAFSLVCHMEGNFEKKVIEIVKQYYPEYKKMEEVIELSESDVDNILEYFGRKDALIDFASQNKYIFKDNFYTTFVRLKTLSEIEARGLLESKLLPLN